ncbi:hypothetical protein ACLKA7_007580 [Drosophila subpalustris]
MSEQSETDNSLAVETPLEHDESNQKAGNDYDALSAGEQLCDFCATKCCTCGCPQLEAEPLRDNAQLWSLQVRSHDIDWRRYVRPLDTEVRGDPVYLDRQSDFMSSHRRDVNANNRRELLVCHDMMGNYLADRHYQSSAKFDDYRFVHWSAVDYFCYFSHQYVTIPPSGWLNAAHRHGVPVLGTYIVESDAGSRHLHEVLSSVENVRRTVSALTRLCQHFHFEGWLVNVECSVRADCMPNLYRFVDELRRATETQVPHGRVFWYDSVIDSGTLSWQNELNERNVQFFRMSHGTLINYTWNENSLKSSEATVRRENAAAHRVFQGLDVFGRGQVGRFQSAQTLARIARRGFSAGIFAPAWCYESLQQYGYDIRNDNGDEAFNDAFLARNEKWWSSLWEHLATHPYRQLPFYTDFCVGSGRGSFECGARDATARPFFNLSRQALQPSVPLSGNAEHCFTTAYAGGCALRILNFERAFRLFLTDFPLPLGVLLLGYAYRVDAPQGDHHFDVVLRCRPPGRRSQHMYLFCGGYTSHIVTPGRSYISPLGAALPSNLIHEQLPSELGTLGINWRVRYYLVSFDGPVTLLDIGLKCRRPQSSTANAYFGAIYVQSLQLADWNSLRVSDKLHIAAYKEQLWAEQIATSSTRQ